MKVSEEGRKMLDLAGKANNSRICPNCTHFEMCKWYEQMAAPMLARYATKPNTMPVDVNRIAEMCTKFRHQGLERTNDNLYTV
jgi:hypothetical protein